MALRAALPRTPGAAAAPAESSKAVLHAVRITFLVRNLWGIGGTIKTTLNTAEALADAGHEVTLASCVRSWTAPGFTFDPRVRVVDLWDRRRRRHGGEWLSPADLVRSRRPSFLDADRVNNMPESSRLLDRRVAGYLRGLDTDVLVGTQVSTNLYMAEYGRPGYAMVAQEHLFLERYPAPVRDRILAAYPRFDAIATVTEADAAAYRAALPECADRVRCVPNSIPPAAAPSALTEPVVMAAGRLTGMKGLDVLIEAFDLLAADFPEWRLRIYGRGPEEARLRAMVAERGLEGRVELPGAVAPLDAEWGRASIAAIPSRYEPFGLVIVEAMAAGLPVVCTAVKHGPLELVDDGENGLLVPPKRAEPLAEALRRLMSDPALRRRLAAGGRRTASRYEPDRIVERHLELFERALTVRGRRAAHASHSMKNGGETP
ncbi:glycosyltransferase [Glycomyces sp. A-F 0318]|uniref:glycosyltransferase n=1 Tax=Glycomyces amatae TaxID=2881355 RepID=UPI001E376202|nr:glycosyltransferase [Glycomyces amatae]MCD0443739.1 glycosyltransferase [Glycomyces amatae]